MSRQSMVALGERRECLEPFARFHFAGHWDSNGTTTAAAVCRVAKRHGMEAQVHCFPCWLVRLAAPFHQTMRELLEMRYLWEQPLRLDNACLLAVLGREADTPLDLVVERTLKGLGGIELGEKINAAAGAIARSVPPRV